QGGTDPARGTRSSGRGWRGCMGRRPSRFGRSLKTVPDGGLLTAVPLNIPPADAIRGPRQARNVKIIGLGPALFAPVGRSEDFSRGGPDREPEEILRAQGRGSVPVVASAGNRGDRLNGDAQVRHDRGVLSAIPPGRGREPCALLGRSLIGPRPRGPRRILTRRLGPQEGPARFRGWRGRRCHPSPD